MSPTLYQNSYLLGVLFEQLGVTAATTQEAVIRTEASLIECRLLERFIVGERLS